MDNEGGGKKKIVDKGMEEGKRRKARVKEGGRK